MPEKARSIATSVSPVLRSTAYRSITSESSWTRQRSSTASPRPVSRSFTASTAEPAERVTAAPATRRSSDRTPSG